jgi:hypothetical protein
VAAILGADGAVVNEIGGFGFGPTKCKLGMEYPGMAWFYVFVLLFGTGIDWLMRRSDG